MLPMLSLLTKALLLTSFVVNRLTNENAIVGLSDGGMVRGAILRSDEGRPFYAFRGIPYAEPPVGQLRFKAPVPKTAWSNEVFDATKDGPSCVQYNTMGSGLQGVEDCLTINVYTQQLPDSNPTSNNTSSKRAVMVFIHGGGFEMGDGTSRSYHPSRMMDSDVILVTLNYRLDLLGFLSTEDDSAPGNYGLLDQVLAMRWVQENIELFGGDAGSVTICGESAGGASVSLHLLSPLSNGLFHRAIMMSGSSLSPWSYIKHPLEWAMFAANASGCPTEPTLTLVDCLRAVPATRLVGGAFDYAMLPYIMPFPPTADGHFLLASPKEIMTTPEKINHVPVLSGITTNEAAVFLAMMKESEGQLNFTLTAEEFTEYVYASALSNRKPEVVYMIRQQYFSFVNFSDPSDVELAIINAASHGMFDMPHYQEVKLLAEAGVPVYAYSYDYVADGLRKHSLFGASHFEDLFMLFDFRSQGKPPLKANDRQMSREMIKLWTDFAKTGNPTPEDATVSPLPKWAPSSPGKIRIHHICQPMGIVSTYNASDIRHFQFWTKDVPEARDS